MTPTNTESDKAINHIRYITPGHKKMAKNLNKALRNFDEAQAKGLTVVALRQMKKAESLYRRMNP